MGFFDIFKRRPYKLNSLNFVEKAAAEAALQAAIHFGADNRNLNIERALKDFRKGALDKDELTTVIACVAAALAAMKGSEDPDRSSELKNKQITEVSLALAFKKLHDML